MWRGTGPVQTSSAAKGADVDFNEAQAVMEVWSRCGVGVESVLTFKLGHRAPVLAPRQSARHVACMQPWVDVVNSKNLFTNGFIRIHSEQHEKL